MEQLQKLLAEIEFSDLPGDLQSEVQSLSEKIGADFAFSGKESLAILSEWHSLEQNKGKQQKIARVCKKIIAAMSLLHFGDGGKMQTGLPQQKARPALPVSQLMREFSEKTSALGYSAFRFDPTPESARKMVSALYLYYGVSPGSKIKKTGDAALGAYVDYSLEGINKQGGQVALSDASALISPA
jgi:hypothetical protein